jgi:hypothetical protein
MTRQIVGTNSELYKTGENDTTQEKDQIFVWKDIWRQVDTSKPRITVVIAAWMQMDAKSFLSVASFGC